MLRHNGFYTTESTPSAYCPLLLGVALIPWPPCPVGLDRTWSSLGPCIVSRVGLWRMPRGDRFVCPGWIRRLRSTQPVFLYGEHGVWEGYMLCASRYCRMCQSNNDVTKGYENGCELPIEGYLMLPLTLLPHTCSSTPWQCTIHSLHLPTLFGVIQAQPASPFFHVDRPIVQSSWPICLILLDSLSNRVLLFIDDDEGSCLKLTRQLEKKDMC